MLPEPETFDGFVSGLADHGARLAFVREFDQRMDVLRQRSGRARALAVLEAREAGVPTRILCLMLGVKTVRVQQLVSDGRKWRAYDAEQAEVNGA